LLISYPFAHSKGILQPHTSLLSKLGDRDNYIFFYSLIFIASTEVTSGT
jgi:hypothetical protein